MQSVNQSPRAGERVVLIHRQHSPYLSLCECTYTCER
uniref:Uncharacterized protein n=1 Tax=Anguilla anguilla TaxID=7936 RepID=A0A0E9T0F5_ANGAN